MKALGCNDNSQLGRGDDDQTDENVPAAPALPEGVDAVRQAACGEDQEELAAFDTLSPT